MCFRLIFLVSFILFFITGCSVDLAPLEKKTITQQEILINDTNVYSSWPSLEWWKKYHNNDLNELIEYAINNSPTIEVARARFFSAVASIKQVNPANKIDINLLANFSGNFLSKNSSSAPQPLLGKWTKAYSTGFSLSYQLDLWGVNKGLLSSVSSTAKAQGANVENAKLLIASTTAQNYFLMQLNFARLKLAYQQLDIQHQILADYNNSLKLGVSNNEPIIKLQNSINNLQSQISTINNSIKLQKSILIALVGGKEKFINNLSAKPLPSIEIYSPKILNYELLSRRADLQAQKWLVESSIGLVASSKAAFYPSFNLNAFAGLTSISLDNLFSLSSKQFNIVPTLNLPIFNTGFLKAKLLYSKAKQNEAIANYNSAIVNAVKDVNIAIINLNTVNEQIYFAKNNFNLAKQLLANNTSKFDIGILPELAVLNSRLDTINKEYELTSLIYQRAINDVDLIKALGGGYQYN